jgi:hypothetical protein
MTGAAGLLRALRKRRSGALFRIAAGRENLNPSCKSTA